MKLNHCFSFFLKLIFFKLIFISYVNASDYLDNKVKKLTLELRCMTCQNQSVHDSDADFSNDIRKIVKKKFKEGKSENEIKRFLVDRYGEYILFRPLINFNNFFLWTFPFIIVTFSLIFLVIKSLKK